MRRTGESRPALAHAWHANRKTGRVASFGKVAGAVRGVGRTRAACPGGGDGGRGGKHRPWAIPAPQIAPGATHPPRNPCLSREQQATSAPWLISAVFAQAAVAGGAPFTCAATMVRLMGPHLQPALARAPLALMLKAVHRLVQGAPCGEDGRWRPLGRDLAAAGLEQRPKIFPLAVCHENRRARRAPFAEWPLETHHGRRSPGGGLDGSVGLPAPNELGAFRGPNPCKMMPSSLEVLLLAFCRSAQPALIAQRKRGNRPSRPPAARRTLWVQVAWSRQFKIAL